ncbi:MAG: hypothetical protein HY665_08640 [Chloroflexi bacterium]|nr:hypothetical protein [Chloroflexota bacterium]
MIIFVGVTLILVGFGMVLSQLHFTEGTQPRTNQPAPIAQTKEKTMPEGDNITQNIYSNEGTIIGKIGQLNVQGQPQPAITISDTNETALNDGTFQYTATLNVATTFVIPKILIVAQSTSVKSITARLKGGGYYTITKAPASYKGITYQAIELQNVSGNYLLTIISDKKESIPLIIQ